MGGGDSVSDIGGLGDPGAAADGMDLPAAVVGDGGVGGVEADMDFDAAEDEVGPNAAEAMGFDLVDAVDDDGEEWTLFPGVGNAVVGGLAGEVGMVTTVCLFFLLCVF